LIDFNAVISKYGAVALRLQRNTVEVADNLALDSLRNHDLPARANDIRHWLWEYNVLQGINVGNGNAIAQAILDWYDARASRNVSTLDEIVAAHSELMEACTNACDGQRQFTSLASKALWLCYPDHVPIFDSFAQRALWMICKLDKEINPPNEEAPEYGKFVHYWMEIYRRYSVSIESIDIGDYPYRVRVFDKILWILGTKEYAIPEQYR